MIEGAHTNTEDFLAILELGTTMRSAGFPLHKWTASERTLSTSMAKVAPAKTVSLPSF